MFCKYCGKEMRETQKFCPSCGRKNEMSNEGGEHKATSYSILKKSDEGKKWRIVILVILAVVVGIVIFKHNSKEEFLNFNLKVINDTGFDIYALYASEKDVDDWEEDILEDEILYDGESFEIEFIITEDSLDWDFAIEDMNGDTIEFYGLSFEECDVSGATLVLKYDGYEGTATLY